MNVLSLFDGIRTGRVVLERLGIEVDNYFSSEVHDDSIKIADKNYPEDAKNKLGDVRFIDCSQLPKIDLLIGGSPCQGFSIAGKRKGSSTLEGVDVTSLEQYLELKKEGFEFNGQSYLFWEYVRILKELKPKYFLLENVRVSKKWLKMFNEAIGAEPVYINSSDFSAQKRPRYYWTNIPVESYEPKNINLEDILEDLPIENKIPSFMTKEFDGVSRLDKGIFNFIGQNKACCLTTGGGHGNKYLLDLEKGTQRKLTAIEMERLQTLPDNYTEGLSWTSRGFCIGNGWTVDVIAHIFKGLK